MIDISGLSIAEIKKAAEDGLESRIEFIQMLISDPRPAVKRLGGRLFNAFSKKKKDIEKLESKIAFDEKYSCGITGGCDEAGRGPLAGPVVAAIVILPKNCKISGIDDSKKLSASQREKMRCKIIEVAADYSFGAADNIEIDSINILQATYLAAYRAYKKLKIKPETIMTDALKKITGLPADINIKPFIKGDAKSQIIAAASVIAKTERDAMMLAADSEFPEYEFKKNKGYGTADHINALKKFGLCPIHRKTFVRNILCENYSLNLEENN